MESTCLMADCYLPAEPPESATTGFVRACAGMYSIRGRSTLLTYELEAFSESQVQQDCCVGNTGSYEIVIKARTTRHGESELLGWHVLHM